MDNFILKTDAYKQTHWMQYPEGTKKVYSYLESRGGSAAETERTLFFGLQMILKKYFLGSVVTAEMIDEAEAFCKDVFGTDKFFNRKGWERIVNVHKGKLPIYIRAVDEGTVVPAHNVLMTIENTDPKVPFITNFVESMLLKVWYPTTVATLSWEIRQLVSQFARETGGDFTPFFLHDFGYRGVSSEESAEMGGAAHLVNFLGTDTLVGITAAIKYYGSKVCGHSVMSAEHSTVTAYGPEGEARAYETFIDRCPDDQIISIVSDSYDLHNAVDYIFGCQLRQKILKRQGKLVVRPDSGDPPTVAVEVLEILWKRFGGVTNEKGHRVLNPKVGVIYGDGINYNSIKAILQRMKDNKFCANNIVFGMGGALLQQCNRDTHKFAIKCSAIHHDQQWKPVFKKPKTDSGKDSKQGRFELIQEDYKFRTVPLGSTKSMNLLSEIFTNGRLMKEHTFEEIRKRAQYA